MREQHNSQAGLFEGSGPLCGPAPEASSARDGPVAASSGPELAGRGAVKTDRAPAAAARQWEETFDAIDDMVVIIGPDRRIVRANRAAKRNMAGLEPGSSLCHRLMHGAACPPDLCPTELAFATGEPAHAEVFEERTPGRWFDLFAYPIRDECGGTRQVVHIARDITARKQAERNLQAERRFSDTIVDTTGAVIVVLDADGRITRFNRACEAVTGFSAAEVVGRPAREFLIPEEELDGVREAFGRLLCGTPCVAHENHWLRRDGSRRLISWAATRLQDGERGAPSLIVTGIDVTDRRALEQRLHTAARLESVGRLAGAIAHDFNNLLTAILGYVDLNLTDSPPDAQLHEDLLQIRAAGRRAADLTRQLLTFSRQRESRPDVIDLNAVVGDMCKMLAHMIEENVRLEVRLCETPLKVAADPAQVGQVIMNLAVNARDAMPAGGLLAVATAAQHGPGGDAAPQGQAVLTVTDTGVGMSPEVRERIFDPFFTTKERGGTGLGLSTVYGIVQQHKGRIECQSESGVGTTFSIYLPLLPEQEATPPHASNFEPGLTGDETILLVEDAAELRLLAARILEDLGYTVLSAADGPAALELLRAGARRPHLLITDLLMPHMDGRELAREVFALSPQTRTLYITGYPDSVLVPSDGDPGAQPLLRKPFSAARLARRVREVLDMAQNGTSDNG